MDDIMNKIKETAAKAKDGAGKFAKIFAKRTSNAINSTKISISISEANSKIKDIYTEIGETMYEKYLNNEPTDPEFEAAFQQIDKLMVDIGELYDKKAELKNEQRCKECGTLNKDDADFCSKCGATLECDDCDVEIDEDEEDTIDDVITITPEEGE